MLDLHRLRLLREVHERGTIHGAAQALGYSPSAVSQQLAVLEREARAVLLERVGRNVRLTAAGHVLVVRADTLLAEVEQAESELANFAAGRVAGIVRIASIQSAFLRIVAPALTALETALPEVRVEVTHVGVEQSAVELRLQHLDLVIGDEYAGQPHTLHKDLRRKSLLREQIRVVLPASHSQASQQRVSMSQLAAEAWATAHPNTGHREMHLRVCRELGGFEPDLRYASDDFLILLELVRSAGACALLPDLLVRDPVSGVEVRSLVEGAIEREVFVLTRRRLTPAVSAVADALDLAAVHR